MANLLEIIDQLHSGRQPSNRLAVAGEPTPSRLDRMLPRSAVQAAVTPVDVQALYEARQYHPGYWEKYSPTLSDRLGSLVYDTAKAFKFPFPQRMREEALFASDFLPGVGTAFGFDDAKRQLEVGNYGSAAAIAALGAAAALPVVGGILKKGGKQVMRKVTDWVPPMPDPSEGRMSALARIPSAPQRPFDADYPAGAPKADDAGRLLVDIEGTPLNTKLIVGRHMMGQPDRAATDEDLRSLARAMRVPIRKVPPRLMRGNNGMYWHDGEKDKAISISIANGLLPDHETRVVGHEVGHMIDYAAKLIPADDIEDDLRNIYHNTVVRRSDLFDDWFSRPERFGPEHRGYSTEEIRGELMAEAIRAYLFDPNWIKTFAPKVAARIRETVNPHPRLRNHIQFNSLAGGALGAGFLGAELSPRGDEQK